jgi:hypothetical protein
LAAFATEVRPIVHLCVKEAFCTSFALPGKVMRSGRRLVSGTSGATPRSRKACHAPAPGARSRTHTQNSNLFTPEIFKPPILFLFPTTPPKPQPDLSPSSRADLPFLHNPSPKFPSQRKGTLDIHKSNKRGPKAGDDFVAVSSGRRQRRVRRGRPPLALRFPRSKLAPEERRAQPPPFRTARLSLRAIGCCLARCKQSEASRERGPAFAGGSHLLARAHHQHKARRGFPSSRLLLSRRWTTSSSMGRARSTSKFPCQ